MLRKSIAVLICILFIFLSLYSEGYANILKEIWLEGNNSPVYRVVLPTSYEITVDSYQLLSDGSMIDSPYYYILNKGENPVMIHISFQLYSKEGIAINLVKERNQVRKSHHEYDIWFAILFDNENPIITTYDKLLRTESGDIVYEYQLKKLDERPLDLDKIQIGEEKIEVITPSAITMDVEVLSGSAYQLRNGYNGEEKENTKENELEYIYSTEESKGNVTGKKIFYQDILHIGTQEQDLGSIDENSYNILVLHDEWTTRSLSMEPVKAYILEDGQIALGQMADENGGFIAFRFLGSVNPKVNWERTQLELGIRYEITEESNK